MGHILNGMSNSLFDIYQSSQSAKDLWDKLESRYMQEDATNKKFLVSYFNNYKMVDNRPVMEQLHGIEHILNNYKQHKMHMDETIGGSFIIDNSHLMDETISVSFINRQLPPSWKDIKRILKHKKEDIYLEQLGNHLRLEEEYHKEEDTKDQFTHEKIHVVEDGKSNKSNDNMDIDDEKVHENNGNGQRKEKEDVAFIVASQDILKVNIVS